MSARTPVLELAIALTALPAVALLVRALPLDRVGSALVGEVLVVALIAATLGIVRAEGSSLRTIGLGKPFAPSIAWGLPQTSSPMCSPTPQGCSVESCARATA